MTKPNEKCPCGTGLKYKKCCSKKDRKNKSKRPQVLLDPTTVVSQPFADDVFSDEHTTWKHYGERHSSYRFFIGQRVEAAATEGFVPGKVVKFNFMRPGMTDPAAYQILLDHSSSSRFIMALTDSPDFIRPLGFTKTDTCALCGVGSTTMKLSNCSACQRVQYCSGECQKADWKTHKPLCRLITEDKKRLHDDAKKQARETKTPQELTEMLVQAVHESNKSMVKRLLKMKEGSFDINQRSLGLSSVALRAKQDIGGDWQADWQGYTPLPGAVRVYRFEQNLSIIKRLLKVKTIDVNKYELIGGGTPLWHACQSGLDLGISIDDNHDELVELLKSAGGKYLRNKV
jgi:hypothetical protein